MTDVTLSEAIEAFNKCEIPTGQNDLAAKITTDLINNGSNAGSIVKNAALSSEDAKCVTDHLNGKNLKNSTITGMFNRMGEKLSELKHKIDGRIAEAIQPDVAAAREAFQNGKQGYDATAQTRNAMAKAGL